MEASGRLEGIRQDTRGRSQRSTSPDPRGPWAHHLRLGVAAGVGEGMEGATKEGDENYYGEFYTLKH